MVKRGLSASNGFWNTSCAWRRKSRRSLAAPARPVGAPSKVIAPAGRLDQLQHQAAERGLAAARFADDGRRRRRADVEGDAVERVHGRVRAADDLAQRARHREVLHDIAKLDERCHVLGSNAAVRRVSASLSRRQAEWWAPLPRQRRCRGCRRAGRTGSAARSGSPSGGSRRSGGLPSIGTSSSASDKRSGKALRRPIV